MDEYVLLQEKYGNSQYMIQEKITQSEHARQAAAIAYTFGAPEDVVIGLLFHDVGQLANKERVGDANYLHEHHDRIGAQWLGARGFPKFVQDVAEYHTIAKIYLCELDVDYYPRLSEASKISYQIQKKKYEGSDKYRKFINHPKRAELCGARLCDDFAKMDGILTMPDFTWYNEILDRVLSGSESRYDPNWINNLLAATEESVKQMVIKIDL